MYKRQKNRIGSNYSISSELYKVLAEGSVGNKDISMSLSKGLYILGVRLLKNGDNTLIYNYMYYPSVFTSTFLSYLTNSRYHNASLWFKEIGDLLVLINKDVLFNCGLNENEIYKINSYFFNNYDVRILINSYMKERSIYVNPVLFYN